MRSKESAHDYRYFPEPDLPVLKLERGAVEAARLAMPELPWTRAARLVSDHGLDPGDAKVLCEQRELADYYEACAWVAAPRLAGNWVRTELLRVLRERDWTVDEFGRRLPPGRLGGLLAKVADGELPGPLAKQAFAWMLDEDGAVGEVLARHEVRVRGAAAELLPLVREVLDEQAPAVARYLSGKTRTFDFLVGQVMKKCAGEAVPEVVRKVLSAELERRGGPASPGWKE
jgi:aspartyl-tRNA(Asn)/glutamyl-tRNA(Gln) amidotransferase subunit B